MQNFKKKGQISIYSLPDLKIGHCVELTFFESKLGGFFVVRTKNLVRLKTNSHPS